ncbi:hypothetical protein D3Z62_02830 [Lachnospiraceae bacterium]|nr:hypothetical protein [Lachnospiraceae bacterium]
MSRTLRKQMLTMIGLLDKANGALKVNLTADRINESGIRQLLSECQETAITMGNELEMIYGEGTGLVHKLEEYHESLYQMTLVLKHPGKRYQLLQELMAQVKQARKLLDKQIPDRLEVVFLPYKASMWGSMERLWEASQNDEDCDTYVVPVPYYDRSPEGLFTGYHYEGDQMPPHIQVTHYENYNLQKRWPDTVFIQDPYDQARSDISIDPRFYSYEIKKVADTLIYISSIPSDRMIPDNYEDIQRTVPFFTAPGVLNADMVVVCSETVKHMYIEALTEKFGEGTRKDWENKIFCIHAPGLEEKINCEKKGEQ